MKSPYLNDIQQVIPVSVIEYKILTVQLSIHYTNAVGHLLPSTSSTRY
uniref:Uncharacterized protein n=1 Tax=Heterorhabditis bacteriophora TaxID=37862 RepID=A0A1I7WKB1_HETBA